MKNFDSPQYTISAFVLFMTSMSSIQNDRTSHKNISQDTNNSIKLNCKRRNLFLEVKSNKCTSQHNARFHSLEHVFVD